MKKTHLLRKLIKTRIALAETMQKILDLNRRRKQASSMPELSATTSLEEELKVLNATAEIQAKVVRKTKQRLDRERQRA